MDDLINSFAKYTGVTADELRAELKTELDKELKDRMFLIIGEALQVQVDSEGNWSIMDGSIRMAVDDLLTNFNVTERE